MALIQKQNDPEEKIKKLLAPEDHKICFANQLEYIHELLKPENIDIATFFNNQNPSKIRLSKYWISNQDKVTVNS